MCENAGFEVYSVAAAVAAAVQTWAWHPLDVLKTRFLDHLGS